MIPLVLEAVARSHEESSTAATGEDDGSFQTLYEAHFDFVWRNARRMGVPDSHIDDAVQETFLVLYRRLHEFQGRASLKTWLFRVLVRVVSAHRRLNQRKSPHLRGEMVDVDTIADDSKNPQQQAIHREGTRALHRLLDELDDDKRAVFVLAELEQMTVPEIADVLTLKLNTVYARLRFARIDFEAAVRRMEARNRGGPR